MSGDLIDELAQLPDGTAKHAAFIRYGLGESWGDASVMAALVGDATSSKPFTADEMRYIAAHWHDEEDR